MKIGDIGDLGSAGAGRAFTAADYGHAGRPGQKGGSAPSTGKGQSTSPEGSKGQEKPSYTVVRGDNVLQVPPHPGYPADTGPGPGHPELKKAVARINMAHRIVTLMNKVHLSYRDAQKMNEAQWAQMGKAVKLSDGKKDEEAEKYNPSAWTRQMVLALLAKQYRVRV